MRGKFVNYLHPPIRGRHQTGSVPTTLMGFTSTGSGRGSPATLLELIRAFARGLDSANSVAW
jgi:hypothetical protein